MKITLEVEVEYISPEISLSRKLLEMEELCQWTSFALLNVNRVVGTNFGKINFFFFLPGISNIVTFLVVSLCTCLLIFMKICLYGQHA